MNDFLYAFFRGQYDWDSYKDDAVVLWEGQHYVLIRTGMHSTKSRYVYMVDKHGLLYDEDAPALLQIAAGLHPVQEERAADHRVLLHESNQSRAGGLFDGRWCKSKLEKCIERAEAADATYEDDLAGWIKEYEERQAEERAHAKTERKFAARVAVHAMRRAALVGTKVVKDDDWELGRYASRRLRLNIGDLGFCTTEDDWDVEVSCQPSLTEKQFKQFVNLLCKFHDENVKAGRDPVGMEDDDDE